LPADVKVTRLVVGVADFTGVGTAGQPLGGGLKAAKEKGWPVPGSVPENCWASIVAFCAVVTVVWPACCTSVKADWKLGAPGQVTPLSHWVPVASVVQLRLGKLTEFRLSQDDPAHFTVTAIGKP
jgi:hypothetical protein